MKTTCDICKNEAPLYWRRNWRLCEHCAALNPNYARVQERSPDFLRPMNQPNALNNRPFPKAKPCVHCGVPCRSEFRWYATTISACGWGCAGFYMDAQMLRDEESRAVREGEEYVKRSLGVTS